MNFHPDLAELILIGAKTVTRRLTSDNPPRRGGTTGALQPSRTYAVCPGRGRHQVSRIRILEVRQEPLGHLDDAEARREGFPDPAAFESAFAAINRGRGGYDPAMLVRRVVFTLADQDR